MARFSFQIEVWILGLYNSVAGSDVNWLSPTFVFVGRRLFVARKPEGSGDFFIAIFSFGKLFWNIGWK